MDIKNFEEFEKEAHFLEHFVKTAIKGYLKERGLGESVIFPALENVFTAMMVDWMKSISTTMSPDKAALVITKLISGERKGMARREEILKDYENAIAEFVEPKWNLKI